MGSIITEDGIGHIRFNVPDIFVDTLSGNVTCSECGKIGIARTQGATRAAIRTHVVAIHIDDVAFARDLPYRVRKEG